jgi:hypothetical protein
MTYSDDLNVLLRGKQTAFKTAATAPTAIMQNVSECSLDPEWEVPDSNKRQGTMTPTGGESITKIASSGSIETSNETFEDINYWLDSLFSEATSSGSAAPFTREYAAPLSANPSPAFMSLWWGQNGIFSRQKDASVATFKMTASDNSGVNTSVSLVGGQVEKVTDPPALTVRTGQKEMTGCNTAVFVDAWTGTMGTTAITLTAFAYELTVNSNRQTRGFLGACDAAAIRDARWDGQLKISMEVNNTSIPFIAEMLGAPNKMLEKQIQIKHFDGTGANLRETVVQFCGRTKQPPKLFTDRDGVVAIDLVFDGAYNPTFGNWLKVQTKCGVKTLV